jgi:hypothetical protein
MHIELVPTESQVQRASQSSIGIAVSSYNENITGKLRDAAIETLSKSGIAADRIMVVTVSGAWELPFAPGGWPRSTPSGVGLTHARGCRPVEDRPSARIIVGRLVPISRALSLSLDVLRDARDEARG